MVQNYIFEIGKCQIILFVSYILCESESHSVIWTLSDPMDYTVHGILQVTILEWVAFPFSRGSSQSRDRIQVSPFAGRFFISWVTREAHILCEASCNTFEVYSLSGFPGSTSVKNLPRRHERWVWSLGQEDPLKQGMVTHSSILAWGIPWTEEPGRASWGCKELDMTEVT